QPVPASLLGDHLRQLDVDLDVVVEAEQVRENRVDREPVELRHAEEMMADDSLPVRRVDQEDVRLFLAEMLARALVAPAQHLPSALRLRLVAPVVLAVDDVRWVGSEEAADDFAVVAHSLTQTFFASVKNSSESKPPSRPTPLSFMPPNGTRRSRSSQQLIHTVPLSIAAAMRCARDRSRVQTLDDSPYRVAFANRMASASSANGVMVTTGPKISSCSTRHSAPRPVI